MPLPRLPFGRTFRRHAARVLILSGALLGAALEQVPAASLGTSTAGSVSPPGAQTSALLRLSSLLPTTGEVAQIVKLGSRLTVVDLQNRVLEVGGSRDALKDVLAVIARGGMPAYDQRLGISKAEFSKYLVFQSILVPTGKTVKLPVVRDASRVTFTDAPGLSVLRGVSFDLRTGEVRIPEGFTVRATSVTPSSAPDRTLDIRQSFVWNLKAYSAESQNGVNGQLSLYHLANGQVVLRYKRTSMIRGIPSEGDLMIAYQR